MANDQALRPGWQVQALRLLPAALLLVGSLALYPAIRDVLADWNEPFGQVSHGPLAALVVLWLVWRQGWATSSASNSSFVLSLLAVLMAGLLAAFGTATTIQTLSGLAWPGALLALLVGCFGWPALKKYWAPVLLGYFAMPIWGPFTTAILWPSTVFVAPKLVALLGVPMHVNGIFVELPSGTFEIAEGCSGARYVLVGLLLGALSAHLGRYRPMLTVLVIAAAGVLAFFANIVRIVWVIVAGHVTQMQSSLVEDHLTLGWWIFGVAFLLFSWWIRRFDRSDRDALPVAPADTGPMGAGLAVRAVCLLVALGAGPVVGLVHENGLQAQMRAITARIEAKLPGRAVNEFTPDIPLDPQFPGEAQEMRRTYVADNAPVSIYANLYGVQRRGAELLSNDIRWLGNGWRTMSASRADFGALGQQVRSLQGADWWITSAYVIGQAAYPDVSTARRALMALSLSNLAEASGFVAIAIPCDADNCALARAAGDRLWKSDINPVLAVYRGPN